MSQGTIHRSIRGIRVTPQSATIPANGNNVSVTANTPDGWIFLCWLCGTSNGWTGHVYPSVSTNATTTFWTTAGTSTNARNIVAYPVFYQ